MGIPNLFEDTEKPIQTEEWYSLLSQSADDYENCVVKTLTHVKNLRSRVIHEYLQATVEDQDTGNRTCLIAERQNGQDQVILGRRDSSLALLSSSSMSRDLPLPLYSITFESNLKVLDLAGILAETTKIGEKYDLITKNCYWFAITAYQALKLKYNGTEEHCFFWKWRGRLVYFKTSAKGKGSEFEEEQNNRMKWAPGNPVPSWEFLEEVYKSSIRLLASSSEEAEEIIEENLTSYIMGDMDEKKTIGAMEDAYAPASLSSDLGLDEAYEEANQLSDVSEYIKVYNDYKENEKDEGYEDGDDFILIPEDFQILEPTEDETKKLDYVIEVMVGQILAEY
ncbi:hypothetical protein ACHAO9_010203 [Fusarium lateritium]